MDWTPPSPSYAINSSPAAADARKLCGNDAVTKGLKKILEDGTLSDFTFVADGKEWKVHKLVLYFHSDVLHRMSSSESFVESKTGRAELKDIDGKHYEADCVDALVHYLYTSELICPWVLAELPPCERHPHRGIPFLISLANIAEMYNIPLLRTLVVDKLEKFAYCEVPSMLDNVIEHICTANVVPDEMRKSIVSATAARIGCLHSSSDSTVLDRYPEFSTEVLRELARRSHDQTQHEKERAKRVANDNWAGMGW